MYYLKLIKHNESYYDILDIYYDPIFSESYKYLLDYLKSFILEVMEENYFVYCDNYIEERIHIEELMKNIYNIKDLNYIKYKYLNNKSMNSEFILDYDIKEVIC